MSLITTLLCSMPLRFLPCTFVEAAVMAGSAVLATEDVAATRTATECIVVVFVVLKAAEN